MRDGQEMFKCRRGRIGSQGVAYDRELGIAPRNADIEGFFDLT
jgi:hypothetical protein